ncbi:MAG TPA: hypothetical protein VEC17_01870 [Candidatus Binatia bacterium]|nr:hypothetical protein [Candidatus Binatia bacterium]
MENHVYKHDWRHGHHHHKHNTFYGLLAMIFFALIALGVVASIHHALMNDKCLSENKCANDNPAASGTCLVGTVDCNDTPGGNFAPEPFVTFYEQQDRVGTYVNTPGEYQFTVPRGFVVMGQTQDEISVTKPDEKWTFGVSFVANTNNMTLTQAFNDVFDQLRPTDEISEYGFNDMKRSDLTLDGVPAKQLTINNFGDGGSTIIVAVTNGNIYVLRGTDNMPSEYDIHTYTSTLKFN